MKNRIEVTFYKPQVEDLWFREAMMADPETMSYNHAWGGTIPFPREKWAEWHSHWVVNPPRRKARDGMPICRLKATVMGKKYDNCWAKRLIA